MPNFKKAPSRQHAPSTAGRSGRPSSGAPKSGSRSPGHRGFRPEDENAPAKKARWNADERRERQESASSAPRRDDRGDRGNDRGGYAARGDRNDRGGSAPRNDREQGGYRGAGSGARDDRGGRSFGGDRSGGRGGAERSRFNDRTGDRPQGDAGRREWYPKGERPGQRGGQAPHRPAWANKRDERGGGNDRPAYNADRPRYNSERSERPAYNRDERPRYGNERSERPAYNRDDRPARRDDRGERPAYNNRGERPRSERTERPAYDQDRPRYNSERSERPAYDRDDRPARRDDRGGRPAYNNRDERPRYNSDRPERPAYNREDRPARRDDRSSFGRDERREPGRPPVVEDVVLERLEAKAVDVSASSGLSFGELGLGQNIVRVLGELGAESPFPIQSATIPEILTGKDVLGRGRTGSGKTIAFGAPLVERLLRGNDPQARREFGRKPRALILAPTRELALQIDRTVQPIARSVGLFTTQIYGGVPQARQVGALQRGVDIIVGTPGRIEDLINQGRLDLSAIEIVVLDEADHMCDLGFLEPVQRLIRETKEDGQRLLFSATLDSGVATLVEEFLREPSVYEVSGEDQASSTIEHRLFQVEQRDKIAIVEKLADREGKTLVFARTRAFAEQLADILDDAGIPAVSLHGDLNQARRTRNLEKLTTGRARVLVATDVAARGIHIDDITLVVQADIPEDYKTYLHRAGRTGRAGREGTVVTLVTKPRLRKINDLLHNAEIEAAVEVVFPDSKAVDELVAR